MEVIALQVFVSLALVSGAIGLFLYSCRQRDFDHSDRLALLATEPDDPQAEESPK